MLTVDPPLPAPPPPIKRHSLRMLHWLLFQRAASFWHLNSTASSINSGDQTASNSTNTVHVYNLRKRHGLEL